MEKDPVISKLIREGGIEAAPGGFTAGVMAQVAAEPEKKAYKPIIGRGGRIFIILFIVSLMVISFVLSDGSAAAAEPAQRMLPEWEMPKLDLSFLRGIELNTGIVAGIVALFILVLSDAGFNRRNLVL
jgi:hypothetical protein